MATSTQFPTKEFLSPHRYNLSLREHLTCNWPQILTNVTEGWTFPIRVGLRSLLLILFDDVIKYVKKCLKTPQTIMMKGGTMCVWAASLVKNFALEKFWSVVSSETFSLIEIVVSGNRCLLSVIWRAVLTRK